MHIRDARPQEVDLLGSIAWAAKASWGYSEQQLDAWRDELTPTADAVRCQPTAVAEHAGKVLGFYQIDMLADPVELAHFWVQPSAMRQGVGRALLAHAADHLRRAGISALHIDSDPHAEVFYLACGARRLGDRAAPIEGQPNRSRPQLILPITRPDPPAAQTAAGES